MDFLSKPSSLSRENWIKALQRIWPYTSHALVSVWASLWRTERMKVADAKLLFPKVYHFIFREAPTFPGLVFKGPSHLLGSSFRWFKLFQCSVTCKCFIFCFLHMDFECICLSVHYHFPLFSLDTVSFILPNRDNSLWLWCLSLLYQVDIPLLTTAGWLSVDLLMTVWFNWLIVPEELKLSGSCFSLWQAWYLTVEDRFRLVSFSGAYVMKFVFLALEFMPQFLSTGCLLKSEGTLAKGWHWCQRLWSHSYLQVSI